MRVVTKWLVVSILYALVVSCGGGGGDGITGPGTPQAVPVANVSVSGPASTVQVGKTLVLVASATDASGNVLGGRGVSWTSSSDGTATVSSAGLVTGVAVGTVTVTASSEGKAGSINLAVTPPPVAAVTVNLSATQVTLGQSPKATATLKDASGNILTDRTINWTSSQTSIATVDASGAISSLSIGTTTITAISEGIAGSAALTVIPVPVATVSVTLAASAIVIGQTTQATATTKDGNGNVLAGRVVTWSTSSAAVATVSSSGLVTGVSAGTSTITATSEGQSASATISVSPVPVASVSVTFVSSSIFIGSNTQATATIRDAGGNILTGRSIVWGSSNPSIASVNGTGSVSGISAGNASIIATCEGQSGASPITVTLAPVATVTVTAGVNVITVGGTTQAAAILKDAAGNTLIGRAITWASNSPTVATISLAGVVTGISAGTVTITATSEGIIGSDAVTVNVVPISSITVTFGSAALIVGQSTQATAVLKDANGNVLSGRTISWASNHPEIATVSASGTVTGVFTGVASIAATSEGKSGAAQITVSISTATKIQVDAGDNQAALAGSTLSLLTISVRDQGGNRLSGRPVTISVSAGGGQVSPTSGTTDANGQVSGIRWTLGKGATAQSLTFNSGGIIASANATVSTQYSLEVRYFGTQPSSEMRAAFDNAAARIRGIVTGTLGFVPFNNVSLNDCGVPIPVTLNETIKDLVIYAQVKTIDGVGKLQARAGPCFIRSVSRLTVIGTMEIDADDLNSLIMTGRLESVVLHEMLHAVGIGTLWTEKTPSLLQGAGTLDPRFLGSLGTNACEQSGGTGACAGGVAVENCIGIDGCGAGTQDSHWRELTFVTELMTGYIEQQGVFMSLSNISVQSLADLGYIVNSLSADAFVVPNSGLRQSIRSAITSGISHWDKVVGPVAEISAGGRITRLSQ